MTTQALEAAETAIAAVPAENPARDWRVEKYEALGFGDCAANLLADATGDDGFPVYWGDVAKMIERGCSHDAAAEIVL